jgi:hypothetical protein
MKWPPRGTSDACPSHPVRVRAPAPLRCHRDEADGRVLDVRADEEVTRMRASN